MAISVPQPRAHLTPPAHTHISGLQDTVSNVTGPLPLLHFTPSGLWGTQTAASSHAPWPVPGPQPLALSGPPGSLLSSKHFHKLGLDSQETREGDREGSSMLSACLRPFTHLPQCRLIKHRFIEVQSTCNKLHPCEYVVRCFLTTYVSPSHVSTHRPLPSSESPAPSHPPRTPAPSCLLDCSTGGSSAVFPGLTW